MTDTGLTNRLRQHSRRAGIMVGVTMVLTIAICVGGFATIYAKLNPSFSDFAGLSPRATPTLTSSVAQIPGALPTSVPAAQPTATATPKPAPTKAATAAAGTATSTAFQADYQTTSEFRLNFRSVPSQDEGSDTIIEGLDPNTPLQYLNQQQTDDNGQLWMKFELQDGTIGWLRKVDVNPTGANASSTAATGGNSTATTGTIQPVSTASQ